MGVQEPLAGKAKLFGCGFVVGMLVATIVCVAAVLLLAVAMQRREKKALQNDPTFVQTPGEGDAALLAILNEVRDEHRVPAIGAAVATSDGIEAMAVTGVRKKGTDVAVALGDQWHLGSNTKAMTAMLAAMLVEEGKLQWSSTLGELFPEIADMHADFRDVTLDQILAHRGGFPANVEWQDVPAGEPREQRVAVLREALARAPEHAPGAKNEYSNLGYVVVGAIAEKVDGRPWEEQMRSRIFEPLGMASAGFGGTGTPGEIDQPWPHLSRTEPAPSNGPAMDNPPVMGPAGTVHCSVEDYCRFLQDHLRAGKAADSLLKPGTYDKLHTPAFGDEMAAGWVVADRGWAGGVALNHAGCNTMNYVVVWMAPAKDKAVAVFLNVGDDSASLVADDAASRLIECCFE